MTIPTRVSWSGVFGYPTGVSGAGEAGYTPPVLPSDGTFAIFTLGYEIGASFIVCGIKRYPCGNYVTWPSTTQAFSKIREKYTYATCSSTVTGVGQAQCYSYNSAAAGNGSVGITQFNNRGLFYCCYYCCCGSIVWNLYSCCYPTGKRDKYIYAIDTVTAATDAFNFCTAKTSAVGNSTRGIFTSGYYCSCDWTHNRNKYTYATDVNTFGGFGWGTFFGSAAGNSTTGIFALGNKVITCCYNCIHCNTPYSTTREKYIYATCTAAVAAASASVGSKSGAATGNSTRGIFALGLICTGTISTSRDKYTYATDTSTALSGAALASNAGSAGSAAGNSTRGIFSVGITGCSTTAKIRNKYTYATCVSTTSGVGLATYTNYFGNATSWATGVNS